MPLPRLHGTSAQAEQLISKQKEMATWLSKTNPSRPGQFSLSRFANMESWLSSILQSLMLAVFLGMAAAKCGVLSAAA